MMNSTLFFLQDARERKKWISDPKAKEERIPSIFEDGETKQKASVSSQENQTWPSRTNFCSQSGRSLARKAHHPRVSKYFFKMLTLHFSLSVVSLPELMGAKSRKSQSAQEFLQMSLYGGKQPRFELNLFFFTFISSDCHSRLPTLKKLGHLTCSHELHCKIHENPSEGKMKRVLEKVWEKCNETIQACIYE